MAGFIYQTESEEQTRRVGGELWPLLQPGMIVLLNGELGAGKTTLVRGILAAAGWEGPVRSPTFNLIQLYDVQPPVLHADLYRLGSAAGLGLEEYLDTHVLLIEWPDRLKGRLAGQPTLSVTLDGTDSSRMIHAVWQEGGS